MSGSLASPSTMLARTHAPTIAPFAEVLVRIASATDADWVDPPVRDQAIRTVFETCEEVFAHVPGSFAQTIEPTDPANPDLDLRIMMAAPVGAGVAGSAPEEIEGIEQQLQTRLRVQFGWEQAAVFTRINPQHLPHHRPHRRLQEQAGGMTVFYPQQDNPGGAVAPVIVAVPKHGDPHYREPREDERRAGISGWLGALCMVGIIIVIAIAIGPLMERNDELLAEIEVLEINHEWEVAARQREIETLERENQRLTELTTELSRRPIAPRVNRPPQALPDTDRAVAAGEPNNVALASATPLP